MTLYARQQKRHRSPRFLEAPVCSLFLPLEHTVVFLVFFICDYLSSSSALEASWEWRPCHLFIKKFVYPRKYSVYVCMLSCFSCVRLCATPWTVAHQAPLSMGFSWQEYWSGLPCPPPGHLPDPGIKPVSVMSPAFAGGFFTTSATWEAPTLNALF